MENNSILETFAEDLLYGFPPCARRWDLEIADQELWSPLITHGSDHTTWAGLHPFSPPPPSSCFSSFIISKWIFLFNTLFGFCHCHPSCGSLQTL